MLKTESTRSAHSLSIIDGPVPKLCGGASKLVEECLQPCVAMDGYSSITASATFPIPAQRGATFAIRLARCALEGTSEQDRASLAGTGACPRRSPGDSGTVDSVVFPTGIDQRDDLGKPDRFDVYYGMADDRIGVARLDVPEKLPLAGLVEAERFTA